jgi:hypothetical protein
MPARSSTRRRPPSPGSAGWSCAASCGPGWARTSRRRSSTRDGAPSPTNRWRRSGPGTGSWPTPAGRHPPGPSSTVAGPPASTSRWPTTRRWTVPRRRGRSTPSGSPTSPRDHGVRDRRAAGAVPASDAAGQHDLVAGDVGARLGVGPRLVAHPGRARRGRVRRQRPEDLEQPRPPCGLVPALRPDRPRRAQARHQLPAGRPPQPRHRGSAAALDDRRGQLQRAVLQRRARAGRGAARSAPWRLGRGDDHAQPRARGRGPLPPRAPRG